MTGTGVAERALNAEERTFSTYVDDFPHVYEAPAGGLEGGLAGFLAANKDAVAASLAAHGALLFRGFGVASHDEFQTLLEAAGLHPSTEYPYGVSPRPRVSGSVFESTQYTNVVVIAPHTEMAYLRKRPRWIAFWAELPPERYGETPVFDMKRALERLPDALRRRFEDSDMRYVRYSGASSGRVKLGRTIAETFETEERAAIEKNCRELGIDFRWADDDLLRTETVLPAVIKHPVTGERVLNAQFVEPDSIIYGIRRIRDRYPFLIRPLFEAYLRRLFRKETVPYRSGVAEGPPLTVRELETIARATYDSATVFRWRQGDVMLIDNIRAGHGRLNVRGPRRILTALGDFYDIDEVRLAA